MKRETVLFYRNKVSVHVGPPPHKMEVTELGMVTEVRVSQSLNAETPMEVTG